MQGVQGRATLRGEWVQGCDGAGAMRVCVQVRDWSLEGAGGCPWALGRQSKVLKLELVGDVQRTACLRCCGIWGVCMCVCVAHACLGRYEKLGGHCLFKDTVELKSYLCVWGEWRGHRRRCHLSGCCGSLREAVCVSVSVRGGSCEFGKV